MNDPGKPGAAAGSGKLRVGLRKGEARRAAGVPSGWRGDESTRRCVWVCVFVRASACWLIGLHCQTISPKAFLPLSLGTDWPGFARPPSVAPDKSVDLDPRFVTSGTSSSRTTSEVAR